MYSKLIKRAVVAFIVFLPLLIASSAFSQVRYNVIDLGSLPGYEHSLAWSINNYGQVVGEASSMSGLRRAVLFDTSGAGNNINLGTLGGNDSSAMSINDLGQIVGGAANPQQDYLATIFDPTGFENNIGLVASNSAAYSINNSAQIAGSVFDATDGCHYAALFDFAQQGNYITLGSLPNYDSSEAYSINDTGTIVGCTYSSSPPDPDHWWHTHAVLFNLVDHSRNIDLGTLAGYEYAAPLSINNNGQIVGRANNGDMAMFNYNPRAMLFDSNDPNKNLDLGTLPGYDSAEAISINNRGQIVGRVIQSSNFAFDAVLFDPSGQENNINLNDLFDHTLGLYLNVATCINDNGWIVGWGITPEWYPRALLLVPIPAGPADFDQNGKVDFYDFATFASAWDTNFGDDNYNPACDLETDGQINYYDLDIFADGWSPGL